MRRPCLLKKKRNGLSLEESGDRGIVSEWNGQWRDREFLLAMNAKAGAARCQKLHGRATAKEFGDVRGGTEDLLAVIENDEHLPRVEGVAQHVPEGPFAGLVDAQGGSQCREDEGRVTNGGEIYEDDPIREGACDIVDDRQGEARFAHPAGTDRGQEGHGLVEEQRPSNDALGLPAYEAGPRDRRRRQLKHSK
jgi:hypothetical protein